MNKQIFLLLIIFLPQFASGETKEQICASTKPLIMNLVAIKDIMNFNPDWSEIRVNRSWYQMPLDAKESIVVNIGKCMAKNNAVRVLDGYSGKKVASYNPLFGFKVE